MKRLWGKSLLAAVGALAFLALTLDASAQQSAGRVTFTKDILPILQENCQTCHRPSGINYAGMIAPMSLMTYREVRPWAKSMLKSVRSREMPPWHASPRHRGVFENERGLTEEQISTLERWVATGAAIGRPEDAPEPIVFSESGWSFGEPDFIIQIEPYLVADNVEDQYVNLTVGIPLEENRWIQALEFKPGSEAVHHVIGYARAGGEGFTGRGGMVGGIAPGNDPDSYPEGYGALLPKQGNFVFAMHYHKESGPGTAVMDYTQVGFKFHDREAKVRLVHIESIGNQGRWEIPPYHPDWAVGSSRTFDQDVLLISMMPHLHLRGKAAEYVAHYPDGTRETLLWVPNYDFNWQESYNLKEPKLIPAGTRLENTMWFDNSVEQAQVGGFNPGRPVRFGGPTTDEMDLGWISYVLVDEEPGTE